MDEGQTDNFEAVRQLWKGDDMKAKEVLEKADEKLDKLTSSVLKRGWTKWIVLAAIVLAVWAIVEAISK
jgi:hypothetical protein